MPSESSVQSWKPYVVMAIGLMAVSTAAIFIRFAQEVETPSLVVAAGRLTVAAVVLTPITLLRYRHELRNLRLVDIGLAFLSGLVLGIHFASWITSLEYTSVVNSVVLVTTNPLWVALMAPFLLNETINRAAVIGLALAIGGGVLVALSGEAGSPPTRAAPLLGNALAVIGAVMAAIYFVIGRRLRACLSVIPYIWLVYGAAAVVLLVTIIVSGDAQQMQYLPTEAFIWVLLLGLFPQLIGHSSFNYALGYLPAAYVSLVVLAEPIGSGILAIIFLDEWPVVVQLMGAALILIGIGVATREQVGDSEDA